VWDLATGQPVGAPLWHNKEVQEASFSPDGGRVATASSDQTARVWDADTDQTARVWDADTGQPVTPPLKQAGPVAHAAFSPDGQRVLTRNTPVMSERDVLSTVTRV
jgi:WD40 repeat protein